jgi:hypothetical protein
MRVWSHNVTGWPRWGTCCRTEIFGCNISRYDIIWNDDIEMDLKEIDFEDVNWIAVAHYRVHW